MNADTVTSTSERGYIDIGFVRFSCGHNVDVCGHNLDVCGHNLDVNVLKKWLFLATLGSPFFIAQT
jgi:hypothetical protein